MIYEHRHSRSNITADEKTRDEKKFFTQLLQGVSSKVLKKIIAKYYFDFILFGYDVSVIRDIAESIENREKEIVS